MPVTRDVVHRFVPGETVPDALASVAALRDSRRFVSVDYLGEDVTDTDAAEVTVRAYLELLDALGQPRARTATGHGRWRCRSSCRRSARRCRATAPRSRYENAHTICEKARDVGAWVTVDAEDHTTTDSTLSIVRDLRTDFDWLGTVLQAYLKRTEADCEEFAAAGARIRLCKGAYDEPASVAYRDGEDVTDSYLRCLRVLMAGSGYPMVASHDPAIIDAVPALRREFNRGRGRFRIPDALRHPRRGAAQARRGRQSRAGVRAVRHQWYGYFVRRLAERPANLTFFLRALAERRR